MSQHWCSTLRETVKEHPLVSNVVFSFVLVVLEKLVDMEFVCPCKKRWENALFTSAFFIIPGLLALFLMISLQNEESNNAEKGMCEKITWGKIKEDLRKFCEEAIRQTKEIDKNCIIPAVAWIIILLFDGRYIACGMTEWPGTYVTADKALVKWCETDNSTLNEKQLMNSQDWYFHSQCAGLVLTLLVACLGCCIQIWKCWQNKNTSSGENGTGNETAVHNDEENPSTSGINDERESKKCSQKSGASSSETESETHPKIQNETEGTKAEEVISMTDLSPTVQSSYKE